MGEIPYNVHFCPSDIIMTQSEVLPGYKPAVHPLEQDMTQNLTDQYQNECKMVLKSSR